MLDRAAANGLLADELLEILTALATREIAPSPLVATMRAHLKALALTATLWGREEAGAGAVTVPAAVPTTLAAQLAEMIGGRDPGNVSMQISVLHTLSISDANTAALISAFPDGSHPNGVLDVVATILTQGREVFEDREQQLHYTISSAREQAAALLLNLALSAATAAAVAGHAGLVAGIAHAVADSANLTARAARLLKDISFQLEMEAGGGQAQAVQRVELAAATKRRHIMISYCWDQQAEVLRIRAALKSRGYTVWIDIEQMQGSTVDAMADAIDSSYIVAYCVSRAYKESSNCVPPLPCPLSISHESLAFPLCHRFVNRFVDSS